MNLDPEVLSESSVEHLHGRAAAYRQLSDECERQEFLSNLASYCHDLAYSCLDEVARREAVAAHVPSIYGARQWCLVCTHYEPRDDCCNGCGAASEHNLRQISFEPKVHNAAADALPTTSDAAAARVRGEHSWNRARDQARHVLKEASAELAQLRAELGMLRVDFVAVDADRSEAWGAVHALRDAVERLKGSAPSALVDWARSTLALWDRCTTREETNGGHLEPPNSTVLNVLVGVYERDKLRAALADTKGNIAGLTAGGLTAEERAPNALAKWARELLRDWDGQPSYVTRNAIMYLDGHQIERLREALAEQVALAPVADAAEELEQVAKWARNFGGRLTWNDVFDHCDARAVVLRGKETT